MSLICSNCGCAGLHYADCSVFLPLGLHKPTFVEGVSHIACDYGLFLFWCLCLSFTPRYMGMARPRFGTIGGFSDFYFHFAWDMVGYVLGGVGYLFGLG